MRPSSARLLWATSALGLTLVGAASADEADPYRYWRKDRRESQRAFEAALLSIPDPVRLRAFHDQVAGAPHVAGTAGDARVIAFLVETLRGMGLEVEKQDLRLYLARPLRAELAVVAPSRLSLPVREEALPEDPWSRHRDIGPGWWPTAGAVR